MHLHPQIQIPNAFPGSKDCFDENATTSKENENSWNYVVQTAFLHSDAVYVFNRKSFQELRSEFSFENLRVLLDDPGILQRCSHFQQKCA